MAVKGQSGFFKKFELRNYVMIAALAGIWILFAVLTHGTFLLFRNISNLTRQMAIVGILGTGMVLVIITGNIDLSVGSVMGALGGIAAALQIWNGVNPILTMLVVLCGGLIIGLIQGSIVSYLKVPAFIVTLGGLLIFRGVLLGVTKGISIAPFADIYKYFGQAYVPKTIGWIMGAVGCVLLIMIRLGNRSSRKKYGLDTGTLFGFIAIILFNSVLVFGVVAILNSYIGIPVPVAIMIILVILFSFVASKTVFGRSIYAMGGNLTATQYSGINVRRNLLVVFMLNGFMAAIAGIILSARLDAGTPTAGQNLELDAIAAAVIGGASMSGGSGKVAGAILGAIFMASIDNGMSLMNMDAYWQYIVKGIILVTAVWFDIYTNKLSRIKSSKEK